MNLKLIASKRPNEWKKQSRIFNFAILLKTSVLNGAVVWCLMGMGVVLPLQAQVVQKSEQMVDPEVSVERARVRFEQGALGRSRLNCVLSSFEDSQKFDENQNDPDLLISDSDFYSILRRDQILNKSLFNEMHPTPEKCFLNKKELFAIERYTGTLFGEMNQFLRFNDSSNKELKQEVNASGVDENPALQLLIKYAINGLKKLKPYEGYVKRADSLRPDLIQSQIGKMFQFKGFTSTSLSMEFPGEVQSLMYSRTCRYIGPLSASPEEDEVLCLPGTRFKLLDRQNIQGIYRLILTEVKNNQ